MKAEAKASFKARARARARLFNHMKTRMQPYPRTRQQNFGVAKHAADP